MLVGEGLHCVSPHGDDAKRRSFSQERDAKNRAKSATLPGLIRVFGIGQNVEDMNDFALKQDAPGYRSTVDSSWVTCGELGVFPGESIGRFEVENFALRSTYGNRLRLAQARRRLD